MPVYKCDARYKPKHYRKVYCEHELGHTGNHKSSIVKSIGQVEIIKWPNYEQAKPPEKEKASMRCHSKWVTVGVGTIDCQLPLGHTGPHGTYDSEYSWGDNSVGETKDEIFSTPSGAETSHVPPFDLVSYSAIVELSNHMAKNAKPYNPQGKFEAGNWEKGIDDDEFVFDRVKHLVNHSYVMLELYKEFKKGNCTYEDFEDHLLGAGANWMMIQHCMLARRLDKE